MRRNGAALSRRSALIAGITTTAAVGASACAPEPPKITANVVSDLGGLVVNAREFGVVEGAGDVSSKLQGAIDFARNNGLTLYIPAGEYVADGLILRDHSRIVGAGTESTVIRSVPGSTSSGLLTIDSGQVRSVLVEGIALIAGGTEERHGIHVAARRGDGDQASGLWHSDFRNVRVYNFGGAQLWLQGGGHDALDPVQFLTFSNVVLERRHDSARSLSLLISGQVNQTLWLNGRIDGFGSRGDHPGTNVKICRQLGAYAPETDGSTQYVSNRSGHSHLFANVSFQQAQLGVFIDAAESISFDTCHFEGLDSSMLFSNSSGQNRVDRCHFANSAMGGEGAFTIKATNTAVVSGTGNVFIGEYGITGTCDDSGAQVRLTNSMGDTPLVTRNLSRRIDPAPSVAVGAATSVILNASPTAITTVEAARFPGESLVFKASGGSVFFAPGGNIDFGATALPIEIAAGGTLTLVRFDDGDAQWSIQAVHRGG